MAPQAGQVWWVTAMSKPQVAQNRPPPLAAWQLGQAGAAPAGARRAAPPDGVAVAAAAQSAQRRAAGLQQSPHTAWRHSGHGV